MISSQIAVAKRDAMTERRKSSILMAFHLLKIVFMLKAKDIGFIPVSFSSP